MAAAKDGDVFTAAEEAGLLPTDILDFSGSICATPLSERIQQTLRDAAECIQRYPDGHARALRRKMAEQFCVPAEQLCAGNGTCEFIYAIPRALRPRRTVILAPSIHDYWRASDYAGAESEGVLAAEAQEFVPDVATLEMRLSGTDLAFIGNPNNPTGVAIPAETIRSMAGKFPRVIFVIDETHAQFAPDAAGRSLLGEALPQNVILLRSPSPLHGLPGVPIGFMLASAELCGRVEQAREPWTFGAIAQCLAEALLQEEPHASALREAVIAERERVRDALSGVTGIRVFRSETNFLLLKITRPGLTSSQICDRALKQRVLVRNAAGFRGLDGRYLRVSIRSAAENDLLITALKTSLTEK